MPNDEGLTYDQMRKKRSEELARRKKAEEELKIGSDSRDDGRHEGALDSSGRAPSTSDERRVLQDLDDRRLESKQGHEFRAETWPFADSCG